jgi:uncharacterized repeat protein (TIGR01451 family)
MDTDRDPVGAGRVLTYTVTVQNFGPAQAADVGLFDLLPAGARLVSATPSQGSCGEGPVVSCALGTLSSGQNATVDIEVVPGVPGEILNVVGVASSTTDPYSSNNSDSLSTAVVDITAPRFRLGGSRRCELLTERGCFAQFEASERATATASGVVTIPGSARASVSYRLRGVRKRVAGGAEALLKLRVGTRVRRAVGLALLNGRRARATIKVTLRDRAGNTRTRRRSLRIVR